MKRIFYLLVLLSVSCSKKNDLVFTEKPVVQSITKANPIYKNYNQPSILLRESDVWIEHYQIPRLGVSIPKSVVYGYSYVQADFNSDGFDDVVFAPLDYTNHLNNTNTPSPLELYINDGTNNRFTLDNSLIKNNLGTVGSRKAIVGDFNGDKKPDVIFNETGNDNAPFNGGKSTILISDNDGKYIHKPLINDEWYSHGVCSGDFDNNGTLDVYLTGVISGENSKHEPYLLINDGKGNFVNAPSKLKFSYYGIHTCEMFDLNHDGYLDLIIGGHSFTNDINNQPAKVLWGNGIDFDSARSTKLPNVFGWDIVIDFNFKDLDGDGTEEIILNRTGDNQNFYKGYRVQILKSVGKEYVDITDTIIKDYISETSKFNFWLRTEDIDKNGRVEIFVSDKGNRNTNIQLRWEKDVDGIFKRK
jgi:hypothetical protein